jgi:LacI family transcriptional regulator
MTFQRRPSSIINQRPTMTDIAAVAHVSLKTVSRVVNGEAGVRPRTAERVQAAIAELGYRPNGLASTLARAGSTATIGLVIEDVGNPFYGSMTRAIEDVARVHGCALITASSDERPEREQQVFATLVRHRVDGIIIVPAAQDHRYMVDDVARGTPVVFVDRPPIGLVADTVLMDDRAGARAAIRHLVESGHRRIGILAHGMNIYTARERLAGARDAILGAGLTWDPGLVRVDIGSTDEATSVMAAMLESPTRPTAYFMTNNRVAIGALRALRSAPEAPDIVVFDDVELRDVLAFPISVIRCDVGALGTAAANLLFERLDGSSVPPHTVVVPTELVPAASMAATASAS